MLSYSTTRIDCILENGSSSTGTGFFLYLNDFEKEEEPRVALITNRHVIENAVSGFLTITKLDGENILNTEHLELPFSNFQSFWLHHPDESIDLCMLNFKLIEQFLNYKREQLFYCPIPINFIPSDTIKEQFDAVEDVLMIGYPDGIWDSYNNKPIFRKGITATDIKINYEGRNEFLIDMAVFGGSSGSPIFVHHKEVFIDENGFQNKSSLFLVGILYEGFEKITDGEVKIIEVPQQKKAISQTTVSVNLGIVVKSQELLAFRTLFYPENV